MPYSTIPITSGAAKFSTLDPDANLFLEENNITVGANPENPATLYDYDSSTLNISNINGNNGEVNLSNCDLIGVKQFVCADYLGSIKCTASNNQKWTITLNDVSSNVYSKQFKTPNNIISSTIKMSIYATNSQSANLSIDLDKYDPNTSTYTTVTSFTITANKPNPTLFTSSAISINAGEIYAFHNKSPFTSFRGSLGVGVLCDVETIGEGLWIVL